MSDQGGSSDSFDPKSWLGGASGPKPAPAPPASKGGDDSSFDPSTWGRTPDAEAAADPAEKRETPTPKAAPPRRPPRRMIFAAGGAMLLLGASLTAAYLTGEEAAPAPGPQAPAPVAAAAPADGQSRRTVTIAGAEALLQALIDLGVPQAEAVTLDAQARGLLGATPGELRLLVDLANGPGGQKQVAALEVTRADGSGAVLTRGPDGAITAQALSADLSVRTLSARGEMDGTSFYSSAVSAGINDSLISDFANAFSFDVNFQTEVLAGDVFEAAFDQDFNPAGDAVGTPRLLFVSLRTKDKSLRYYRFTPPGETEPSWFDANGRGNKRALMRTPVDGARVTSNFGPRFHPVLHYTRLHGGTDFAAPVGTPIYAAAAGTVTSASPSACAGNMVILRHDNGWETRYFHAARYADGIVAGARVNQGQTIADVGNTGKCTTGPHLHYEVHINGEKVDPMSIDTSTSVALEGAALAAFMQQRERVDSARAGQMQ